MLKNFRGIWLYIVAMTTAFGFYIWGDWYGHRLFGDDNELRQGQQTIVTGGHGVYFHK